MKKKLIEEINRGNTVNLGRSLTDEEVEKVIQMTSFLKNPKNFNERVYCIINDITQQPLDVYGKPARFINVNRGYSYKVNTAIKELKGAILSLKKRSKNLKDTIKNNTINANPRIKSIKKFKTRNQNRNAHLYDGDNVLGENYVVCPVTGERMYIVKTSYIENVLKMDTAVYDCMYPGARTVSEDRINRIKTGLRKIDPKTGLTKHKLAQVKANLSLSSVGDDGLTGYDRKGIKTRNTHMNNIDEHGRNGYQQQVYNRLNTYLDNGLTVEQNSHIKRNKTLLESNITGFRGASKISKIVLNPIIKYLDNEKIKYYFDKNEYGIKDPDSNNYYFWDLTIPTYDMAIEYQSSAWHAYPFLSESEWKSWKPPRGNPRTADEVLDYDYNKAKALFKSRNMCTYYVWEKTKEDDVRYILCLLKTMNTKY